jgi:hypothetical protein
MNFPPFVVINLSMNDDSGILAQGKDKAKTDMARLFAANAGLRCPD